ncbi:Retrovirus-related Pol polyprotein [Aphis craccivora]|uniref:Retrovirus-related Pol polyprotein n=1 Tax=Aphis craccivora TaxID=307492 RepID=A0A6G0VN43_APHCR|nr:Retrovirus-related Pol polyprotein [Aphis craccivora]
MIKLSELQKDVRVDESTVYELTGINSLPVFTIGTVVLTIQLESKNITATFQVMNDDFPIPEAGILGAPFLRENGVSIDFKTSTLSIEVSGHPESPEPQKVPQTIIIQPRSETLIPIVTNKEDGTTLLIHAQPIGEKGILLGNIVNKVNEGQILVSVINTSEDHIELCPPQLGDL